jgi:hypothetical protein
MKRHRIGVLRTNASRQLVAFGLAQESGEKKVDFGLIATDDAG